MLAGYPVEVSTLAIRPPTGVVEVATRVIEVPTGVVQVPTRVVKVSAGVVEIATRVIDVPTRVVEGSSRRELHRGLDHALLLVPIPHRRSRAPASYRHPRCNLNHTPLSMCNTLSGGRASDAHPGGGVGQFALTAANLP
jgi:hypothetical protein